MTREVFRPPSLWRVVWLVCGLMWRRRRNTFVGAMRFGREKRTRLPSRRRVGTARKPTAGGRGFGGKALHWIFVGMIALWVTGLSMTFVDRMASIAGRVGAGSETVWVSSDIYRELSYARDRAGAANELAKIFRIELDANGELPPAAEDGGRSAEFQRILAHYDRAGIAGFSRARRGTPELSELDPMPEGASRSVLVVGLFFVLSLGCAAFAAAALAGPGAAASRADPLLGWLLRFPVPTFRLLVARWLAGTFAALPIGGVSFVLLVTLYIRTAAFSPLVAVLVAVCGALAIAGMLSAAVLVLEIWMRVRLSARAINTFLGGLVLVGGVASLGVMWCTLAPETPEWLFVTVQAIPEWFLWTPLGVFGLPALDSLPAWQGVGWALGESALVLVLALGTASLWLRGGFERTAGSVSAVGRSRLAGGNSGREGVPATVVAGGRALGPAGKAFRMLVRDRKLLVQSCLVPFLIVALQLVVNPHWIRNVEGDVPLVATIACGIGCYVALFVGRTVVDGERTTFWMRFTFPQSLIAGFLPALVVPLVLVWAFTLGAFFGFGRFQACSVELVLGLSAVLAASALTLVVSTGNALALIDPLGDPKTDRPKGAAAGVYGTLSVVGVTTLSIRTGDGFLWGSNLVLLGLVAAGFWQRAEDRLSYALDPVSTPPPRLGLFDGAMAVFGFAAVQVGFMALFRSQVLAAEGAEQGGYVLGGFALSATIILASVWTALSVRGLSPVDELFGEEETRFAAARWVKTVILPLAGGALLGCGALAYLEMCQELGWFEGQLGPGEGGYIVVLGIVFAPIVEEILFRGMVFRCLARTLPEWVAVLLSAAVFAVAHPPVSWLPVFCLGVATAWACRRTGYALFAPMLVHGGYNALLSFVTMG